MQDGLQYAGAEAAIEATSNYYAIYDTLNEYADVVVADPDCFSYL